MLQKITSKWGAGEQMQKLVKEADEAGWIVRHFEREELDDA